MAKKFTEKKMTELFNAGTNPQEYINEQSVFDKLLINYSFTMKGKEELGKYIRSQSSPVLRSSSTLANFEDLFNEIRNFIVE